ncbi:MAG: mercury methylation ferredoxin HgcB [Pseudomonadota bacterium]
MKGFEYLRNVSTLSLVPERCIGCGRCVEVCPHQVFTLAEKPVQISNLDACMECGACMKNCPVSALQVDAGVGCAAGLIAEWFQDRYGRAPSGACCS